MPDAAPPSVGVTFAAGVLSLWPAWNSGGGGGGRGGRGGRGGAEAEAEVRSHLADRFLAGGPMTLRGFEHAGIGPQASRPAPPPSPPPAAPSIETAPAPRAPRGGLIEALGAWRPGGRPTRGPVGRTAAAASERSTDALGGDLHYSAAALLSAPLPHASLGGARAHCFLNAGSLVGGAGAGAGAGTGAGVMGMGATFEELLSTTRLSTGVGIVATPASMVRFELNWCWLLRHEPGDRTRRAQFGFGMGLGE